MRRPVLAAIKRDTTSKLGVKNKRFNALYDADYRLHLLSLIVKLS